MPPELLDAARGIRLQKVLAESGLASRRTCEELIREGRVRVNGHLIRQLPIWVDPRQDRVTVDGRPVRLVHGPRDVAGRKICMALNKPRGVITTAQDPQGRRTVLDLIDMDRMPRLFPVGRLDADSTGLILLTNDGDLAQRLTHPSYGVPKRYHVSVKGRLTDQDIAVLKRGLVLAHPEPRGGPRLKRARVADVQLLGYGRSKAPRSETGSRPDGEEGGERTRLAVTLREGQNREIRRLLAKLGFKVRRLQREAIGPITVKGLPVGGWRLLTDAEVRKLLASAGEARPPAHPMRRPSAGRPPASRSTDRPPARRSPRDRTR